MPITTGLFAYILLTFPVLGRGEKPIGDSIPAHKAIRAAKGSSAQHPAAGTAKGKSKPETANGGSSRHTEEGRVKVPPKVQYGVASFYADKFEGRKTYTDEIFTQDKLTGASNTLPMHTWVKVTNLRNHRFVYVRINDKMHPRNKRLIDLSRAAARQLGYMGNGLARVRIDILGKKKPPEAKSEMAIRRPGQD
jgi:rare lipoprotein A